MKNTLAAILAFAILLFAALGCSLWSRTQETISGTNNANAADNKTLTDRVLDTAVGQKRVGVPECDDVLDAIEAELNNPDDDIVTKAVKATVLNRIKDGIRESVEKNKTNRPELARRCTEYRAHFDKYKADHAAEKK
jgi:hypothetical protein